MSIKVFKLDDCDWWAGESLDACVAEAKKQCGADCYDDPDDYREVSPEGMEKLKFRAEDNLPERTFAQELQRLIDAGEEFPQLFASTEF